jgi:uncharacterized protein (TIGR02452 family)
VSVAVAAAFRVQLVLKRKRFAFSSITFSFPPEIRFFADLFPDTPDSVWHRTSSVDEFPMDRHRSALRAIADDNAARYAAQSYRNRRGKTVDLAALIARSATTAIPPDAPLAIAAAADRPGRIELTQETTIGALYRLIVVEGLSDVVALNYANAVSPGGGYLDGARAQEEACCRASTLYYELAAHGGEMYEYNAYGDDGEGFGSLASDFELITRDVIVWRDDRCSFLDRPFLSAFVTAPAPNAKVYCETHGPDAREQIEATLDRRIRRIVQSIIANGFTTAVLGPFGCGAFGNDGAVVARIFYDVFVTEGARKYFEKITFAVWDPNQKNWDAFNAIFKDVDR